MVAGDSPLLSGEVLDGFLSQVPADADLCYPVVSKRAVLSTFPDRGWTFIRLREGEVVCTNVLFFRASLLRGFEELPDRVEIARRKPWKLAALFGPWLLARYLMGWLSVRAAERRLGEILGAKRHGVLSDDALLAMGLDDPRDLPFVEDYLKQRTR
jgi:hypothetical protein